MAAKAATVLAGMRWECGLRFVYFRQFSAILAASTVIGAVAATAAPDGELKRLKYSEGAWPCGKTLEIEVDITDGLMVQTRYTNPDCQKSGMSGNVAVKSTRRLNAAELELLAAGSESVWIAGTTTPSCPPQGHIQVSLSIVKSGQTKTDDYMIPQCQTDAAKAFLASLRKISATP